MATTRRLMRGITAGQVFGVLEDGKSYADWVFGTRAVRAVDETWPSPGSRLHYTIGYAPLRKDDITTSRGFVPESWLELEAHAWPAGSAKIVLRAEPADGGTMVSIEEEPSRGIARRLHNPAFDLLIKARNVETLRRLENQARRR